MARRSSSKSRLFAALSIGTAFALCASSLNGQAFTSASLELKSGQTARLSLVNNGGPTATETLTISDAAGLPLATHTVLATQSVSIAPGASARLDYVATANVGEIHAKGGPCNFPVDLQILDRRTLRPLALIESFLPPPAASLSGP